MAIVSFYVFVIVICGCALSASSAPAREEPMIELSAVIGKSVCPIRMHIDEDKNRIPSRIKMLKCDKTPNPLCRKENMTHACCRHRHHSFSTECMEVIDHVLVRYIDRREGEPELSTLPVSVGCTCMIHEGTQAGVDS